MNFLPDLCTETWILLVFVVVLIAIYGYAPYTLFKRIGVKGPTPWPFIGMYFKYQTGIIDFYTECYKKYGKVWGLYEGRVPMLFIMDTDMIKTIFVKEGYSVFLNRKFVGPKSYLAKGLPLLKDEDWKRVHRIVSTTFSSGRMKEMFPIMLHHSSNLIRNFHRLEDHEAVDIKKSLEPYALDVLLGIFFSADMDTLNNPSSPFLHYMQEVNKYNYLNLWRILSVVFPFIIPILEKMNVAVTSTEALEFFLSFTKTIKAERKNKTTDRVDFIQLMINAQTPDDSKDNPHSTGLTDEEVTIQALIFTIVGNNNMATSVAFAAYNLALHPHVQKKLQVEIDRTFPGKCQPTYEELMQMKYLDMVITESLRLYPIGNRIERVANSSVEVSGVIIPKGMIVTVPIHTLHRDPDVWPDPDSFKPERFSNSNKGNIDPYGFLTFGTGSRACIAMRLSMLILKLALVEILQHFNFVPCKETDIPLELARNGFVLPKKPIMLKLEPREPVA